MRLLLAVIVAAAATGQQLEYRIAKETVLQERLKLAHPKNAERYIRLKALFAESGCERDALREQRVKRSKQPNIICSIAGTGESPRTMIVGAHFDAAGGDGVVDNWSGAILLTSLYENLGPRRRHRFEFVAFAAEEQGLLGSQAYLRSIAKMERGQIAAVITMDSLGLTSTKCWVRGSTPELVNAALHIAASLKLPFAGVNVDRVASTDSAPFKDAHIPVLSLHSVTQETLGTINGSKDTIAAVSWKDYYDTYRLVSALIVYLDQTLP